MRLLKNSLFIVLSLLLIGCGTTNHSKNEVASNDFSELKTGTIKTDEYFIDVFTSNNGPVYTVKTLSGEVLGERLSAHELIAIHDELICYLGPNRIDIAILEFSAEMASRYLASEECFKDEEAQL